MSISFNFENAPKKSNGARQSSLASTKPHYASASSEIAQIPNQHAVPHIPPEQRLLQLKEDGNTLAEAGHFVKALLKWDEALDIDPSMGILRELKAQVLMEMGEYSMALQEAQQAVELDEQWSDAHFTLGRVYLNIGELELAQQSMEVALKLVIQQSDGHGRPQGNNASQTEVEAELDEVIKLMQIRSQMSEAAAISKKSTETITEEAGSSMDIT